MVCFWALLSTNLHLMHSPLPHWCCMCVSYADDLCSELKLGAAYSVIGVAVPQDVEVPSWSGPNGHATMPVIVEVRLYTMSPFAKFTALCKLLFIALHATAVQSSHVLYIHKMLCLWLIDLCIALMCLGQQHLPSLLTLPVTAS